MVGRNYCNNDNKLLLTTKALLSGNLICGIYICVFFLTLHISHCWAWAADSLGSRYARWLFHPRIHSLSHTFRNGLIVCTNARNNTMTQKRAIPLGCVCE